MVSVGGMNPFAAVRSTVLGCALVLLTSGIAVAAPPSAGQAIDIVAPTPGTVVGSGAATVHVELTLQGVNPNRLRVFLTRVGAHRHHRKNITDQFTVTSTSATADLDVHELGAGITRLSARAGHAHAVTKFDVEPALDLTAANRCDFLMSNRCLLPFPNDFYTMADPASPTGRRVHLDAQSLPANVAGVHVDPTEWNRNDGFSPGQPIMLSFPGIDLVKSGAAPITDVARSLRRDAPIVIIDTNTGRRWPYFAELDVDAPDDAARTMIIRPAINFLEGHRYVIGLRDLKDAQGNPIEPSQRVRDLSRQHQDVQPGR